LKWERRGQHGVCFLEDVFPGQGNKGRESTHGRITGTVCVQKAP
jgi:hypothetical protein